jgi:hypothetical protein
MGLSIRAYAKVRGVSHVAVLKAIKAGRIPIEPALSRRDESLANVKRRQDAAMAKK